ncbi:hypothetical protein HanIR_Chr02g0062661 [Helianthus annuus]|nr:hypothetical protein HanIR_Chr02g0062661 [Helianthus annuus]
MEIHLKHFSKSWSSWIITIFISSSFHHIFYLFIPSQVLVVEKQTKNLKSKRDLLGTQIKN